MSKQEFQYQELLNLVAEMRRAQKEYFKGRERSVLIRAATLEGRVDRQLKELGYLV